MGILPGQSEGQVISGLVVSEVDGSPLAGAVVELLDTTGNEVLARLTGPDGTFSMRGLAPARYRFRVGLLGYRTVTVAPFVLSAGQRLHRRLAIPLEPIELDAIRVARGARCRGDLGGTELVQLWEETRKGLMAVSLTDASPLISFRVAIRDRDLDPEWETVLAERVRTQRTWYNEPFRSAPADTLLAHGFIRSAGSDTVTYYGPDARLLLSEEFLRHYCFGVAREDDRIGLTFEPETRLRDIAQIEGVLWLDRETAGLRRLEFTYTKSPVDSFTPSGGIVYEQLPTGAWIVREWHIRIPRLALVGGLRANRVGSIRETRGEVVEVFGLERPDRRAQPMGAVRGRVVAEGTGEPLGNVLVYLNGTGHADTTDIDGRYRIAEVAPGRYRIAWAHSSLRSAEARPTLVPVEVTNGEDAVVEFRVPLPPALAAGCPVDAIAGATAEGDPDGFVNRTGVIWGRVSDRATRVPLAGVEVTLEPAQPEAGREPSSRRGRSDGRGVFRFCDVAPGSYRVIAGLPGAESATEQVHLSPRSAERLELGVAVAAAGGNEPARIVGRVLDAAADTGMTGVSIRVDDQLQAVSGSRGAFVLEGLEPGTHRVRATTLGYAEADAEIRVGAAQTLTVEIRIGYEPIPLDAIVVTATRARLGGPGRLSDFAYRVERGWGTYILRDDIEQRQPFRLTSMLQEHGFRVYGNGGQLVNPRYGCAPMVYLDGVPITHINDRGNAGAMAEAAGAVNMVHPLEVAGIEVYKGISQIPAAFGGSTGRCGVVAIWTRGHRGGPPQEPRPGGR